MEDIQFSLTVDTKRSDHKPVFLNLMEGKFKEAKILLQINHEFPSQKIESSFMKNVLVQRKGF